MGLYVIIVHNKGMVLQTCLYFENGGLFVSLIRMGSVAPLRNAVIPINDNQFRVPSRKSPLFAQFQLQKLPSKPTQGRRRGTMMQAGGPWKCKWQLSHTQSDLDGQIHLVSFCE